METKFYKSLSDLEAEAVAEELMVGATGLPAVLLAAGLVCVALVWPPPVLARFEAALSPRPMTGVIRPSEPQPWISQARPARSETAGDKA
jgi:hypothetical protein